MLILDKISPHQNSSCLSCAFFGWHIYYFRSYILYLWFRIHYQHYQNLEPQQNNGKCQSSIKCGVSSPRKFAIFLALNAYFNVSRQKKCRILTFRNKKCRISTFRDKKVPYFNVSRQKVSYFNVLRQKLLYFNVSYIFWCALHC